MLSPYICPTTRSLRLFCLITQYTVTIDRIITARQIGTIISIRVFVDVGASVIREIVPVLVGLANVQVALVENLVGALLEIDLPVVTVISAVVGTLVDRVVGTSVISVVGTLVGRVVFALEDKLVKVEELVSAPLIEAGVEGLFFVELVVVPVTCLVGFRGSFPNVLKMMT